MQNGQLGIYLEGTLFAAIAIILSLIPLGIGSSYSISLGTIPLAFYAVRRGLVPGIFAGFIWGILHFLLGTAVVFTFWQATIEYVIAFTVLGFTGYNSSKIQKLIKENHMDKAGRAIVLATIVGSLFRYFWHFVAGVIFWGEYAVWGLDPVTFSLLFNGASMISTIVVTVIVLLILLKRAPRMFIPQR